MATCSTCKFEIQLDDVAVGPFKNGHRICLRCYREAIGESTNEKKVDREAVEVAAATPEPISNASEYGS